MADKIVLNTPRFKGEYDFDIAEEPLTALEWRWIKKISEYLPMTILKGWEGGDPDLFIAFSVIALVRAGRIQEGEALSVADDLARLAGSADGTAIKYVGDPVAEVEDGPPAEPAGTPGPTTTGSSSSPTSDPLAPPQSPTGHLASVRSAT